MSVPLQQHAVTFLNTLQRQLTEEDESPDNNKPKRSINRQSSTVYDRKPMFALGILMILLIVLISVLVYIF